MSFNRRMFLIKSGKFAGFFALAPLVGCHSDSSSPQNSSASTIANDTKTPNLNPITSQPTKTTGLELEGTDVIKEATMNPNGTTNENQDVIFPSQVKSSLPSGYYEGDISIALVADEGSEIYYTLDRQHPGISSVKYDGKPLAIKASTTLIAISVKGKLVSDISIHNYVVKPSAAKSCFWIMSDAHINDTHQKFFNHEIRWEGFFKTFAKYSVKPDGILFCGDMILNNPRDGYPVFRKIIEKGLSEHSLDTTQVLLAFGNHDSDKGNYGPVSQLQEVGDWFPVTTLAPDGSENGGWGNGRAGFNNNDCGGYYHVEVNDVDIIAINTEGLATFNPNYKQGQWLKNRLKAIVQEKGYSNPIFIIGHRPIPKTLMDGVQSCPPELNGNYDDLKDILKDYPNVIYFSGHSHMTLTNEKSIFQEHGFTCLNTSQTSYGETLPTFNNIKDGQITHNEWAYSFSECLLAHVFQERVEVERISLNTDFAETAINTPWNTRWDVLPTDENTNYFSSGAILGPTLKIPLNEDPEQSKYDIRAASFLRKIKKNELSLSESDVDVVLGDDGEHYVVIYQKCGQHVHHYNVDIFDRMNNNIAKRQLPRNLPTYEACIAGGQTYLHAYESPNPNNTLNTLKILSNNMFTPIPAHLKIPLGGMVERGEKYMVVVSSENDFGHSSVAVIKSIIIS